MLIKLLIYLLFITFPLGQLVRWEFMSGQIVIRPNDLAALILGLIGWWKLRFKVIHYDALILMFAVMILSLFVNIFNFTLTQVLVSASYLVRFVLYSGIYFVFRRYPIDIKFLIAAIFVVAIVGILQFIFIPDVSYLSVYNWDNHYYRLVSAFLDPGFTAAILCIGIISVYLYHSGLSRIFFLTITYLAFALTYSRAGYLMFLASFGMIAYFKKKWSIFIISVLLVVGTMLILPDFGGEGTKLYRESSSWARIKNWQESFEIFSKVPILGVGFNAYRYVRPASLESHAGAGADSSLLLILATTGILGFVSYLFLLKKIWLLGKSDLIFASSFTGIFINSFFNNTLFYPHIMILMWILLARSSSLR